MANATKGRARVFKDKRKATPPAKKEIQDQLDEDK